MLSSQLTEEATLLKLKMAEVHRSENIQPIAFLDGLDCWLLRVFHGFLAAQAIICYNGHQSVCVLCASVACRNSCQGRQETLEKKLFELNIRRTLWEKEVPGETLSLYWSGSPAL